MTNYIELRLFTSLALLAFELLWCYDVKRLAFSRIIAMEFNGSVLCTNIGKEHHWDETHRKEENREEK